MSLSLNSYRCLVHHQIRVLMAAEEFLSYLPANKRKPDCIGDSNYPKFYWYGESGIGESKRAPDTITVDFASSPSSNIIQLSVYLGEELQATYTYHGGALEANIRKHIPNTPPEEQSDSSTQA